MDTAVSPCAEQTPNSRRTPRSSKHMQWVWLHFISTLGHPSKYHPTLHNQNKTKQNKSSITRHPPKKLRICMCTTTPVHRAPLMPASFCRVSICVLGSAVALLFSWFFSSSLRFNILGTDASVSVPPPRIFYMHQNVGKQRCMSLQLPQTRFLLWCCVCCFFNK